MLPTRAVTDLTRSAGGLVKVLVRVTSRWAQTPLDGADTATWLAASRDMEGVTAKFWSKRHEIACKFRDPSQIDELVTLTAQQIGSRIR
jgi:hypothetical protein